MTNRRFPIMGSAHMLGRVKFMEELWSELTKTTPSNMSLYGPRFIGKTVIVNALAQKATCEGSPYRFVLHWHLGHVVPSSDEEFVSELCEQLRDTLSSAGSDYEQHREYLMTHLFGDLKEVTDSLHNEGKTILMLWDGFDKPLGQGKLTNNLWDQMRSIFNGKRHKILIVTRKALLDNIRSHGISDFWNLFYMNNMRVEPFNDEDREDVLRELPGITFNHGAKTELLNWSSGYPPFYLGILNNVVDEIPYGTVDNEEITRAALRATESLRDLIDILWDDCPAQAKDVYSLLIERGELMYSEVGKEERNCLLEKGFARQAGNKLTKSCRMLQQFVISAGPDIGSIARLFGTWDDYKANIRSLLERRMSHISRFDERLCRLVDRAIEDIPDYPDDCLNNLTSIEELSLDMIWQREFGVDKTVPQELIDYWEQTSPYDKTIERLKAHSGNAIPSDRSLQCGILQLLTGSKMSFASRAKFVTKDTYVLINAIHSFRNRGQHSDGQGMQIGVAVAALMTCLELLSSLEREL
jgi:hypothetical protein